MASPIDGYTAAAEKASKISLVGGSVVFLAVIYAVRQNNLGTKPWHVSDTLLICGLALAAICVILGIILRMYTLMLRERLMEKYPPDKWTGIPSRLPLLALRASDPVRDMALVHTDPGNTAVTDLIRAQATAPSP